MHKTKTIKVLIVDDERLARNRVKQMLKTYPQFEIAGECSNGVDAYSFIQNNKIDLIFLDIQMPEMTGIELVDTVGYKNFPAVVFITAYDQHAIKAFEYCAVDYILKPFDKDRFNQAISQALQRIKSKTSIEENKTIQKLIETTKPDRIEKIFIKDSGLISVVEIDSIVYIESSGNYVTIHTPKKTYLYRQTMKAIEAHLDSSKFVRVHRQYIVHIHKIISLSHISGGDYSILLKNDNSITLSRRYKENLEKFFKI